MSQQTDVNNFMQSSSMTARDFASKKFAARGLRSERGNIFFRSQNDRSCPPAMHLKKLPRAHVNLQRRVQGRAMCEQTKKFVTRKPLVTRTDIHQRDDMARARRSMRGRTRDLFSERKSMYHPTVITKPHKYEVVKMAEERRNASLRNSSLYENKRVGDVQSMSPLRTPYFMHNTMRAREGQHSLEQHGIML